MASPTLQGVLKDGSGEAAVGCDMPKLCGFPSLDSCQKKFLRTHKDVDLVSHPVIGLVRVRGVSNFACVQVNQNEGCVSNECYLP